MQIELDLTPGVAVAKGLLAEIDRDGNGSLGADETQAYAARLVGDLDLALDGRTLFLNLIDCQFPSVQSVLGGTGVITLQLTASLPPLSPGRHRLLYRNGHHPDIGVYLANALVPTSERVAVVAQTRDANQRELVIDYTLTGDPDHPRRSWILAGAAAAVAMAIAAGLLWRRRGTGGRRNRERPPGGR